MKTMMCRDDVWAVMLTATDGSITAGSLRNAR